MCFHLIKRRCRKMISRYFERFALSSSPPSSFSPSFYHCSYPYHHHHNHCYFYLYNLHQHHLCHRHHHITAVIISHSLPVRSKQRSKIPIIDYILYFISIFFFNIIGQDNHIVVHNKANCTSTGCQSI